MSSSSSIFADMLPSECAQHILSYLELIDCLRFTSTSRRALQEGLVTLGVRRHRLKHHQLLSYDGEDERRLETTTSIPRVPTVQDRVEELTKLLPPLYSLHSTVQKLCQALRDDDNKDSPESNSLGSHFPTTQQMIAAQRNVLLPLKLHSFLLEAILLSENDNVNSSRELHEYVGDVLCVAYLLSDNDTKKNGGSSSYAEGTRSPHQFAARLRRQPTSGCVYQSWVLVHAGILRHRPLSAREKSRLGMRLLHPSPDGPSGTSDDRNKNRISSPAAAWPLLLDCYRTKHFLGTVSVLVYDDFGPLGPSFRGRDIVRICDTTAHDMLSCLTSNRQPHPNDANTATATELTPPIRSINNRSSSVAMEWLCLTHEVARQTRPMSMRTPMVRFECAYEQ